MSDSGAGTAGEDMMRSTFNQKYTEFAADLKETFPELADEIAVAATLPAGDRFKSYRAEVLAKHATPLEDEAYPCPGPVLPGVLLTEALWTGLSSGSKKAVFDYLAILDLCCMMDSKEGPSKEWAEKVMGDWKSKMDKVDFDGLSEKLKSIFMGGEGAMPKIPEKFLKGKLAKLAEDMVREFKPEDFGLSEEDIAALEKNPAKAFEILMQASTSNPGKMQAAMMRVAKRLQEKVKNGQLRPEEIVAEAEEMINEFKSQPAFVEVMQAFRSAFSFEDPELARAAGRENDARRALVRDRLRKKLDAKKAGKK